MKNISAALLAFLKDVRTFNRADLFEITLPNGQIIRATNAQIDINFASGGGGAAPAFVQSVTIAQPSGTASSYQATFPSNVGSKSCLMLICRVQNNLGVVSIIDSKKNLWSRVDSLSNGGNTIETWIAPNTTIGATSVLVKLRGAGHFQGLFAEYSNIVDDPFDTILPVHATGTSSSANSGSLTPISNGDLIIGTLENETTNSPSYTATGGFTLRSPAANGNVAFLDQVQANAAAISAVTTLGASYTWTAGIFALRARNALNKFYASNNGAWQRGKIISEASFDLHSNNMELDIISPATILYPGTTVSLMAAAQLGLFDAALVKIFTAYWPVGVNDPTSFISAYGAETKYAGYIMPSGDIQRSRLKMEVADGLFLLNQKMPRMLLQASCPHTLYDENCTLDKNFLKQNNTVASGSTRQSLNLGTNANAAAPAFTQGYILVTSGQNAGLIFHIKQQNALTNLLLASAMPLPLAIGDTFIMYQGCNKTETRCNALNNIIHFGGTPFCPNPETAIGILLTLATSEILMRCLHCLCT